MTKLDLLNIHAISTRLGKRSGCFDIAHFV